MAEIRFEAFEDALELLSPEGLAPLRQRIQVRRDPLLGHTGVYNPALQDKARTLFGDIDREALIRLVAESAERCIFCPGRLEATPRYPAALFPEGRLKQGEAVLFPNLYALARHHAVVVVSEAHFLELREFTPQRIGDAMLLMQKFMETVSQQEPDTAYATLNANYLYPAGASLVHPHFQLLMGPRPYAHQARLLEAWREYREREGSAYAADLATTEQRLGERYIGEQGGWHWLAAWAPLGNHEIQAMHASAADFAVLPESEVEALAEGLSRMLRLYEDLGFLSFNFALYSQRGHEAARLFLRLVARQNPAPHYRSDDYFLQKLQQTELILLPPEELASRARRFFG